MDQFSKAAQASGVKHFFLTHFHYDHYGGLSRHFKAGCIYCTEETSRLVQHKLKVCPSAVGMAPQISPRHVRIVFQCPIAVSQRCDRSQAWQAGPWRCTHTQPRAVTVPCPVRLPCSTPTLYQHGPLNLPHPCKQVVAHPCPPLQVQPSRIKEVPFRKPFKVQAHLVTFVPANHCPGAAMVIFERPGCAPVLHTGDCRYDRALFQACPELIALRGRAILHLDTTYCSPEHCFPPQRDVVAEVVRLCRAAVEKAAGRAPPLFVFGSYTIGKERLFLEVRPGSAC